LSSRFVSEPDFVASYLLPRLKEAGALIEARELLDFHVNEQVDGIADLTVERAGKRLLVIEAKFKKKVGKIERDIEPRDPDVIGQAVGYAAKGGFSYYATCNAKRLVLFRLRPGVKAYESEIMAFEYQRDADWAENVLKAILEVIPVRLKPLDDTLVETLHEAVADIHPEFTESLKNVLQDRTYKKRFIEWLESQGLEYSDDTLRLIAEQSAYLQINKLVFYQVIRTIYPEKLARLVIGEEEDVAKALARFFEGALSIDYQPIYESDIISEIPLTRKAGERIRTLIDTLNEFDFSGMESDFVGRMYEKLISPLERKRLGQFYTPPGIVELIVKLTITEPDAKVLDPGCGSGGFLVGAYHQLRKLNSIPQRIEGPLTERFHQQLLDQLYGVDINQFPAHLSVINLAVQNPRAKVRKINVLPKDFFDLKPGQAVLAGFPGLTTEGRRTPVTLPPSFHAVVANPPYIRQELLGLHEKEKIKKLIEGEFRGVSIGTPSKKETKAIVLDKQSDIYVYFYMHGLAFLKNNGRLGFISSNKWLEVGYGEPFQQFLLGNVKIEYVVEFDRAVFSDAEVNTAVTTLQKEPNKDFRHKNIVRFVRVKQRLDMEELLKRIQQVTESIEEDALRVNVVRQGELAPGKWNTYLRGPPVYSKIVSSPKVKPLGSVAKVLRGPTTGHNDYFILSKEKTQEWEIERKFLRLCISSPKKIRGLVMRKGDVNEYLFMVHEEKHQLKGTRALEYIKHGEKLEVEVTRGSRRGARNLPELETVKNRRPWYGLPKFDAPPILFPRLTDVRPTFVRNDAEAHAPHVFYYLYPKDEKHTDALLAYLNSNISALLVELGGRSYGGGVLELLIYEIERLPVIDPSSLCEDERDKISSAFKALVGAVDNRVKVEDEFEKARSKGKGAKGLFEDEAKKKLDEAIRAEKQARRRIDEIVYQVLGLSANERKQVEDGLRELQELRRLRTIA